MSAGPVFASSGDLLADRRYGVGEALSSEGDHAAAADLFEQTLALAPDWAPAWLALGLAREAQGAKPAAREALRRASALDRDDRLGADLHLARLDQRNDVAAMPTAYVRDLFDQYADRFETHLTETLRYRGPDLIAASLARSGATRFRAALDLGCGTGLMARALAGRADAIDGVDLSPRMIEKARQTGFYRHLAAVGIEVALSEAERGCFDLVVAADVFVYIGSLDRVCREVGRLLRPGGWLAFTVQAHAGEEDFGLGDDMRFSHGRLYVEAVLGRAGLKVSALDAASTRDDRGKPVPGLVVVARAP